MKYQFKIFIETIERQNPKGEGKISGDQIMTLEFYTETFIEALEELKNVVEKKVMMGFANKVIIEHIN